MARTPFELKCNKYRRNKSNPWLKGGRYFLQGVNPQVGPPRHFIAMAMQLMMVLAAEKGYQIGQDNNELDRCAFSSGPDYNRICDLFRYSYFTL